MSSPAPESEGESLGKDTNLPLRPEDPTPRPHRRHPFSSFVQRIKIQLWTGYTSQRARRDKCDEWLKFIKKEQESMKEEIEKTLRIQAHLSGSPQETENNGATSTTPPEHLGATTSTPSYTTSVENSDKIDIAFVASMHRASLRRQELVLEVIKYENDQILADMRESELAFSLLISVICLLWFFYLVLWILFLHYGVPSSLVPFISAMNLCFTVLLNIFVVAS